MSILENCAKLYLLGVIRGSLKRRDEIKILTDQEIKDYFREDYYIHGDTFTEIMQHVSGNPQSQPIEIVFGDFLKP